MTNTRPYPKTPFCHHDHLAASPFEAPSKSRYKFRGHKWQGDEIVGLIAVVAVAVAVVAAVVAWAKFALD